MVLGKPMGPQPAGPAPTFTHNEGVQGPRPGTGDRWGTTVGQDPAIQAQQTGYNTAADAMQNRGFGGWLRDNLLDVIPGFHQVTPEWNKPSSYAAGDYHDAWSVLGAALGAGGMATGLPGAGTALGKIGVEATNAFGLPDYKFGPGGGWHPDESNAIESAYGKPQNPYGPSDPAKAPSLGNPTQGGQQPQISGPGTGVQIFNPMAQQTPPAAPPTQPTIFPPNPPVNSQVNIPGGINPYLINLFRRAA